MPYKDWIDRKSNIGPSGQELADEGRLIYEDDCITAGGRKSDELFSRVTKARLAFDNQKHL